MSVRIFLHRARRQLLVAGVLAYAALMMFAAFSGHAWPYRLAIPLWVLMLALLLPLRRAWGLVCWLALAAGLLWLDAHGYARAVLGTLPILVNAGLCWVFARTLRHGREPLVTRVVRLVEGAARLQSPGVARYSRSVTVYWALLTGLQSLLLGGCWLWLQRNSAAPWWVHAWLHVGGYVLPLLAMLAEYALRRWRFRALPHPAPHVFVRRLVACWPRILRQPDSGDRL